ncbi:MAG: Excisionase family DNA binding domain-containing protein [Candidatus Gottesmanbacteria bacterium GW2011_GWC2_39_8]|uniref:Excisionase family DNA binding domain-containing protein n=1 Tax=Candidatus Gottesmanbacteria bacterium GW2011_GWC2_39_8 TaxID=1618450 RepID=A0A0G0PVF0_9BACT|nr:MAG: Excisionase family DNA binding domain-containing protein [Candidatus Gottesmanbacteria bacterium GW2011_GWC2_39_8]
MVNIEIINKKYYTLSEIANFLGISRIAVFKKVKKGDIKAEKIGRNYAVSREELEGILGKTLSSQQKKIIEEGVKKTVREYGEALRKLGEE